MAGEPLPRPDATLDGGELDCGSGLLLLIRNALEPLAAGGILLVTSREGSVKEDLPAWCRMVGHALLGTGEAGAAGTGFWLQKKGADAELAGDLARARDFVWSARTRWKQGLESRVTVRNHELAVGQPASFDTRDAAPAALELLLGAVGGALSAGLAWRLSREGLALRALEVVVKGRSRNILAFLGLGGDEHSGLAGLDVQIYLDCDGEQERLDALVRETVARCPVTNSLVHGAPVALHWRSI
ncbi:MAG: hypothetical protein FJ299_05910 [Planctomycetes bacterium]|nr:hypothetical protein [Planctomycetota bacterium]